MKIKKKRYWICLIMFIVLIIYIFSKSQYTFHEENRIINYAIGINSTFKLTSVEHDREKKSIRYCVYQNRRDHTKDYIDVYNKMNQYLSEHEDYFLNNGYKIILDFVEFKAGGPRVLLFTNWNSTKDNGVNPDSNLYCMEVYDNEDNGFHFEEITADMNVESISDIIIDSDVSNLQPSAFLNFSNLDYLYIGSEQKDDVKREFKKLLPHCRILFR